MSLYRQFRRWRIARGIRRYIGAARRKREFYAVVGAMEAGAFSSVVAMHIPGESPRSVTPRRTGSLAAGRQAIAMPAELSACGAKAWTHPIPPDAQTVLWEDLHRFAPGAKPKRDPYYGLMANEPPLAMVCIVCELEQTPMRGTQEDRRCAYCGLRYRSHGTRVFWWRESVDVAEWSPK